MCVLTFFSSSVYIFVGYCMYLHVTDLQSCLHTCDHFQSTCTCMFNLFVWTQTGGHAACYHSRLVRPGCVGFSCSAGFLVSARSETSFPSLAQMIPQGLNKNSLNTPPPTPLSCLNKLFTRNSTGCLPRLSAAECLSVNAQGLH